MKYKGYYIDNVCFHSKADIDEAIKRMAVERFKKLNKYFVDHPSIEASIMCDEQAKILHEQHGFTYAEIEDLEISAIVE